MLHTASFVTLLRLVLIAFSLAIPCVGLAADIQFNRDVLPILSDNCYFCHGPDGNHREADLRLDQRDAAVAAGVIDEQNLTASSLLERILSDDPEQIMPPPNAHKSLNQGQKEILRNWITNGAEYEKHWSYIPPQRTEPVIQSGSNPIDGFVASTLREHGLDFSKPAAKDVLARRLYLDIVGIPPTPAQIDSFVNDNAADATERLINSLLASPQFGERMAIHWLDVVRYADTVGFHGDQDMNAWPYRDYVIQSFNQNKRFDQFTIEQIAGDLLPSATDEQYTASCFNRLNMMTREGGAQPGEYLAKYAADRVRTVSMAYLGSTFACAECHDHKFDPITMRDFYSMAAFFSDLQQWGVYADYGYTPNEDLKNYGNHHPFPPLRRVASEPQSVRLEQLRTEYDSLCDEIASELQSDDWRNRYANWQRERDAFAIDSSSGWINFLPSGSKDTFDVTPQLQTLAAVRIRIPASSEIQPATSAVISNRDSTLEQLSPAKTTLKPSVKIRHADGTEDTISFSYATANHFVPDYVFGTPVYNIKDGWRLAAEHLQQDLTSIWIVQTPLQLTATDELVIAIEGLEVLQPEVDASMYARPLARNDVFNSANVINSFNDTVDRKSAELFALSSRADNPWRERLRALDQKMRQCDDGHAWVMVSRSIERTPVRILPRGNWQDTSGELVSAATPQFLEGAGSSENLSRLDLARWLVSDDNPLTSRVVVNRFWAQFFGRGLSERLDDFGAQGSAPTHPELLDWLAVEFRESGWNVKHIIRLIVSSQTYQQSSHCDATTLAMDPDNQLLSRHPAHRLQAELVRDNALAIAGLLDLTAGGPATKPYQPEKYYSALQFPDRPYNRDEAPYQYRRGVYMHWQRTFLHPMLLNFGAPTREDCVAMRVAANTPQQALTLLNDPTFVEAARVFADRLLSDRSSDNDVTVIRRAFRMAVGRVPSDRETESLVGTLTALREHYRQDTDEGQRILNTGLSLPNPTIDVVELAAWSNLCRVLLNLHETITVY